MAGAYHVGSAPGVLPTAVAEPERRDPPVPPEVDPSVTPWHARATAAGKHTMKHRKCRYGKVKRGRRKGQCLKHKRSRR